MDQRTSVSYTHLEAERMQKLQFAVERAQHYEDKTGVPAGELLTAWENERNYWYVNFYQDCNQPLINANSVRVFDTPADLLAAIGTQGFRCPRCRGVSRSPYECNSGVKLSTNGEEIECDWKAYGLFRTLGKGVYVFVKSALRGEQIFMPVAWEGE